MQVPAHWLKPATVAPAAVEGPDCVEGERGGGVPAVEGGAPGTKAKGSGKASGKKGGKSAGAPGTSQPAEEQVTTSDLLAMAQRLESEMDAPPEQLPQLLRRAAARIGTLEKTIGEFTQTLRAAHTLTGQALQSIELGIPCDAGQLFTSYEHVMDGDASKSYLIKRGDEDLQEAHRATVQPRPVSSSGAAGGALSAQARTKEEMDQARLARLERLEAQQADKAREREEAATKARARDKLFEKPFVGKTIGQF